MSTTLVALHLPEYPEPLTRQNPVRRCKERSSINTNTENSLYFFGDSSDDYDGRRPESEVTAFALEAKTTYWLVGAVRHVYHLRVEEGLLNGGSPPDDSLTQF